MDNLLHAFLHYVGRQAEGKVDRWAARQSGSPALRQSGSAAVQQSGSPAVQQSRGGGGAEEEEEKEGNFNLAR